MWITNQFLLLRLALKTTYPLIHSAYYVYVLYIYLYILLISTVEKCITN